MLKSISKIPIMFESHKFTTFHRFVYMILWSFFIWSDKRALAIHLISSFNKDDTLKVSTILDGTRSNYRNVRLWLSCNLYVCCSFYPSRFDGRQQQNNHPERCSNAIFWRGQNVQFVCVLCLENTFNVWHKIRFAIRFSECCWKFNILTETLESVLSLAEMPLLVSK